MNNTDVIKKLAELQQLANIEPSGLPPKLVTYFDTHSELTLLGKQTLKNGTLSNTNLDKLVELGLIDFYILRNVGESTFLSMQKNGIDESIVASPYNDDALNINFYKSHIKPCADEYGLITIGNSNAFTNGMNIITTQGEFRFSTKDGCYVLLFSKKDSGYFLHLEFEHDEETKKCKIK